MHLRNGDELRFNTGGVTESTPEARYQNEFYAAAKRLLGNRIAISSGWSKHCEGRVDFQFNTGWGVELVRDGSQLAAHCRRFEPNGQYRSAIQNGDLTDWLVIDCTQRKPRKFTAVGGAKLIRVVFAEDYASAEILDADNVVIAPMFPLL
jgi:hypothetical protein